MTDRLYGVIPAMVTPRNDQADDVDLTAVHRLTEFLISAGVHGVFPTSSTGEAPLLTPSQRQRVIETVVETVAGRVPVLAGVGAPSTAESIRLARQAEASGATHLAILPLHFVPVRPEELFGYFAAVADSVTIPTLLYNYPARTSGQNIPSDVAARLAADHSVVGIKDSGGDLSNLQSYLEECPPAFAVFVGSEALVFPALSLGAAGTICAAANVCPHRLVTLYDAFAAGDHAACRQQQRSLYGMRAALAPGTFPASVKAALKLRGFPVGSPFPPAMPLDAPEQARVVAALEKVAGAPLDKLEEWSL